MVEDTFEAAIFFQPAGREAGSNARHTGQVVGALTHEGSQFRILRWCHSVTLHDGVGVVGRVVCNPPHRVEHCDVVVDQLEGVTIPGDDARVPTGRGGIGGHGGDDVVCLVTVDFDGWYLQGIHDLFDEVNLS